MTTGNYTAREDRFICTHYREMTDAEIAQALGRPVNSVRNRRKSMGYTKYIRKEWTPEEEQIVRDHYADTPNKEILKMLPRHGLLSLYRKAHDLGLHKSEQLVLKQNRRLGKRLAESGAAHRFPKGHTPYNKGLKQEEFMSADAIKRTKKTRFKKGNLPGNTLFDGALTIRYDSSPHKRPYLYIRLAKAEWKEYHRYLWEKHMGPVPPGHIIVFKDGNSMKCELSNLECITRAENARRNSGYEKAMETMQRNGNHASRDLTDRFVASMITGHDPDLKEYILAERPDLIRAARANYKLNRQIKKTKNQ